MKGVAVAVLGVLLAVAMFVGAAFGLPWVTLQVKRMYGTELQSVETDIYRENKSYVEGTVRDLRELRVEYLKADEEHKSALKSLILHRAGELDRERLPLEIRQFLGELDEI